jgi:hypothetical protein
MLARQASLFQPGVHGSMKILHLLTMVQGTRASEAVIQRPPENRLAARGR